MMKTSRDSKVNIIKAIQTPLGFFVLIVLLVEAIFGVIASFSDGSHRTYLIIGMFALILLLVLIVSAIAVFRPEALYGSRPIRGISLPRSNAAGEKTERTLGTTLTNWTKRRVGKSMGHLQFISLKMGSSLCLTLDGKREK
jgi:uncharacterized membrane protein YuzA (DUF378 family)